MKKGILLSLVIPLLISCQQTIDTDITGTEKKEDTEESKEVHYIQKDYQNPLKFYKQDGSEYFVGAADPDVIKGDDGYYYLYCTNTYCEMGDKGMQYDRGPIFQSKDLLNWKWVASAFDGHPDALNWGKQKRVFGRLQSLK